MSVNVGRDAKPSELSSESPLPILAWWGGFFALPLLGVAAYLSQPSRTLARAYGAAAAAVWTIVLAFWVPFIGWVILFGGAEPSALLVALPIVLLVTIGACINGTIQVRRCHTPMGRQIHNPA